MRYSIHIAVLGLFCLPAGAAPIPDTWIAKAQTPSADAEYELSWQTRASVAGVDAAWQAPNRAHGLRTYFVPDGIRVVPRVEANPSWELSLSLTATGRPDAMANVETARQRADGKRITYDRGGITEWYVNTPEGLEQGFTLDPIPFGRRGPVAIELALEGNLKPARVAGPHAIELTGADGVAVLSYSELKVSDARGRELPSHFELFQRSGRDGIRIVFDDAGAVYPVTVDPYVKTPSWTVNSGQNGAWFGYAVATAGDVNGDGYSDVVIGAPSFDNGQSDEGRAYLYLGSASGLATTPAWTSESDQQFASYGWAVASAGDVNGDGYDDVIVGANNYTNGEFQEGKAYLFYGSASGLAATAGWTAESNQGGAYYGTSVATAGDVNNDGFADVVVGAPYGGATASIGRVYLYLGSASGLATTAVWMKDGPSDVAFGCSVSTAGDVNGDGYADVIIGAEFNDTDLINEGKAYLYLGVPGGLANSPVWTAEGDQAGAQFGHSVATAGDVNGDGYSDVIVGAPFYDNGQDSEGRAFVFHGRPDGLTLAAQWTTEGDFVNARYGISVGTAGDANGDGYADVIVGSERWGSGEGMVRAYFGSNTGLATIDGFFDEGGVPGVFLGAAVATAGDVDGDGFSDLIVGAYGWNSQVGLARVYSFFGADTPSVTPAWSTFGGQISAAYGVSVASAGDVNGDGFSDVLVGSPLYDNGQVDEGRAYLYLGSASGLSTSASWTVEGDELVGSMGISVASAGDVNGDGYSDIIVGSAVGPAGTAFVYYGSPTGPSTTPSWTKSSPNGTGYFGYSVASAGDVNGDGYADVIIGSVHHNVDQAFEGAAFVYLGSPTGLAATPVATLEGNQAQSFFGHSVASAGDVNGDGYSDVIVGAYGYDNGQTDEGRAYVYLGSATGTSSTPAWTGESNLASAFYGISVASAGDLNGDGYSDVVVTAPFPSLNLAGLYVYLGSSIGLPAIPSWTLNTGYNNVAPAGDMDNDGFSDFAAWWPSNGWGAVMYRGSPTGYFGQMNWQNTMNAAYLGDGSPIASAGDVNGDGYPDLIVGMNQATSSLNQEGGAFVYMGAGPSVSGGKRRAPRQLRTDGVTPIPILGRSDSETSFHLSALGMSAAGRSDVQIRWEVKPLGTPFNLSGAGVSSFSDTGAPSGTGSSVSFSQLVSGLGEGASYHWRVRIEGKDPLFPHSPWISATSNGITETKLRMSGCVDHDGDGYGATGDASCVTGVADCDDADPTMWATPGPTTNFRFTSGKTTLGWNAPANPGTSVSLLGYDTMRSSQANNFVTATCIESGDGPNTVAVDLTIPATGQTFFYLNRAENTCPQGLGSLGTTSAGAERVGNPCP